MNTNILKGFITRLDFIFNRTRYAHNNNFELNILNIDNEKNKIDGSVTIRLGIDDIEVIIFEIQFDKSDDMLIFKSKYQNIKMLIIAPKQIQTLWPKENILLKWKTIY